MNKKKKIVKRGLTAKQKRFCEEYVTDMNGTRAAIRAGYSQKTAYSIAEENLKKPDIREYLKVLQQDVMDRLNINRYWVAKRFKDISDRCMQAEPVMVKVDGILVESGEYHFDSSGANKATEALAKHIGFFERDNKQKATGVVTVFKLPDNGR